MLCNSRYFKTDGSFRESIRCALSLADGVGSFSCLSHWNLSYQSGLKPCLAFLQTHVRTPQKLGACLPQLVLSIIICSRLKNLPRDVCYNNLVRGLSIKDTHIAWCSDIVVNRNYRFKSILFPSKVYIWSDIEYILYAILPTLICYQFIYLLHIYVPPDILSFYICLCQTTTCETRRFPAIASYHLVTTFFSTKDADLSRFYEVLRQINKIFYLLISRDK